MEINKTTPHGKVIYIDEIGDLGSKGSKFYILGAVRFKTYQDYVSWRNIAQTTIKKNLQLKNLEEIKSGKMSPQLRQEVFRKVQKHKIQFDVWLYIIDTNHKEYRKKYIKNNKKGKKDTFRNNVINELIQKSIIPSIKSQNVFVFVDGEQPVRVQFENAKVSFVDSKAYYGIQFADLIAGAVMGKVEYYGDDFYIPLYEKYVKDHQLTALQYPRNENSIL